MISKKLFAIIISLILMTTTINSAAAAQISVTDKADILKELKVLEGDSTGYNLEGKLKRDEAVVFISRLLGVVENISANQQSYKNTKFTDVPATAWYAPYVGYCTQNGIVAGQTPTTFNPESPISEKAFLTLCLKTLGYMENKDFTWSNIYQFSFSKGLLTDDKYRTLMTDNTNYMRKDVVTTLYNFLTLKKNGSKLTYVQEMVNAGKYNKNTLTSLGLIKDSVVTSIDSTLSAGKNKIIVKFNESMENSSYTNIKIYETYDIGKQLTVQMETQSGKDFSIKTSDQVMDKAYTIEVSGLIDAEGNVCQKISSSFTGYRDPELKSDFFKISKIEAVSRNILNVYYTHPVNSSSELPANYSIVENGAVIFTGSNQNMTVKKLQSVDNGVTILLKDMYLNPGTSYKLQVSGSLTSVYGVKLNEEQGDSIAFTGSSKENEAVNFVNVAAVGPNKVYIEFNKEIDANFAQKFINYSVIGPNNAIINVSSAVLVEEGIKAGRAVYLTLAGNLDKTVQYDLKVEYLPDNFRLTALEGSKYPFTGAYSANTNLSIQYANALDKNTVTVYPDKALDPKSAEITSYYTVTGVSSPSYTAVPTKVVYGKIGSDYMITLYLAADKALSASQTYKVRVLSVMADINGNTSTGNAEYTFNGSSSEAAKVVINKALIISKDTLKLSFDKDISYDLVNLANNNYCLEYNDNGAAIKKNPMFISYIDSRTLILKFDQLDYTKTYKIRVTKLKDISGQVCEYVNDTGLIDVTLGK